jgi:hypothetical protein
MKTFKFCPELDFALYIQLDEDLATAPMLELLNQNWFTAVDEEPDSNIIGRNLRIVSAGPKAQSRIGASNKMDQYGNESFTPYAGYTYYRYKGTAVMVYSFGVKEWEMGVMPGFAEHQDAPLILSRYLGLALSLYGVIGIWSQENDDLFTVGESGITYFDVANWKKLQFNEWVDLPRPLTFIKSVQQHNITGRTKMRKEELLAFLASHTTFRHSEGMTVPTRQMLQTLATLSEGFVVGREVNLSPEA